MKTNLEYFTLRNMCIHLAAVAAMLALMFGVMASCNQQVCHASELWTITAYDNCKLCCGKAPGHPAYGITASGKRAQKGYVACNWLPFGSIVKIDGLGHFFVMDRGARSLFGDKNHHIKHLDVWMPTHKEARKFGKQFRHVEIVRYGTKIWLGKEVKK